MIIIKGDLNGDGKIDIKDLMFFWLHINGAINLADYPAAFIAADIDNDGTLTRTKPNGYGDYERIERHINGQEILTEVIQYDGNESIL